MVSFDACEGNPGALTFMCQAYMGGGLGRALKAEHAFQRVIDAGIRGSRLYQLWNDCCGRDTEFAIEVMGNYARRYNGARSKARRRMGISRKILPELWQKVIRRYL